jgi:hypothetical protein
MTDSLPYRVVVTLGTPGEFDPLAFSDAVCMAAERLMMAGVTVAAMAGRIEVEVDVDAPGEDAAAARAREMIGAVVGGWMSVRGAEVGMAGIGGM